MACFIISGCSNQTEVKNLDTTSEGNVIVTVIGEETTESATWANQLIQRYQEYGDKDCLLFDMDHDGYMELVFRDNAGSITDEIYEIEICDVFEKEDSENKVFWTIFNRGAVEQNAINGYCYSFCLYYNPIKKDYFYFEDAFLGDGKNHKSRSFTKYQIEETVSKDVIAYYDYESQYVEEGVHILTGKRADGQPIESGLYPNTEIYSLCGIDDYLANYELISDNIFADSNWKPLKERQKDLAECAKRYKELVSLEAFAKELQSGSNTEGLAMDVNGDGISEIMVHRLEGQQYPEQWDIYSLKEGNVCYQESVEVEKFKREFVDGTGQKIQLKPQWNSMDENFEKLFWHSLDFPRERGILYNASGTDIYEKYLVNGICVGMDYEQVQKILGAPDGESVTECTDDGIVLYENYGDSEICYLVEDDIKWVHSYTFCEDLVNISENQIHIGSTREEVIAEFGAYIDYDQGYGLQLDASSEVLVAGKLHYGNIRFCFAGDLVTMIAANALTSD